MRLDLFSEELSVISLFYVYAKLIYSKKNGMFHIMIRKNRY